MSVDQEASRLAKRAKLSHGAYETLFDGKTPIAKTHLTVKDNHDFEDALFTFFEDIVHPEHGSELLNEEKAENLAGGANLIEEFFTLHFEKVIFCIKDPESMVKFASQLSAILAKFVKKPEFPVNVEVSMFAALPDETKAKYATYAEWEENYEPHGKSFGAKAYFMKWFEAIEGLPKSVTLHLVFDCFWRDFRVLRSLASKSGLSKRSIRFLFPMTDDKLDDHDFFVALTVSSILSFRHSSQDGIPLERRRMLVKHGCAGF